MTTGPRTQMYAHGATAVWSTASLKPTAYIPNLLETRLQNTIVCICSMLGRGAFENVQPTANTGCMHHPPWRWHHPIPHPPRGQSTCTRTPVGAWNPRSHLHWYTHQDPGLLSEHNRSRRVSTTDRGHRGSLGHVQPRSHTQQGMCALTSRYRMQLASPEMQQK